MKYSLCILILFSLLAACKQERLQKQQALASHPIIDTFNINKTKAETTTSLYTDDELSEFAIVNDPDGFTYVRDTPAKSGTITDTLQNGTIVFCMEAVGNWTGIDYGYNPDTRMFVHGFISKSRLEFVSVHSPITGLVALDNVVVLGNDKINITLTVEDFNAKEHKLSYNTEHNVLETIDGRHYWGTDGGVPKRQYKSIAINLNGKEVKIPEEGLENLYEPNLDFTSATYDKKNDVLYIQSLNSDGAGGYAVLWRIEKGVYKDRFMFYGF
jgi:hypothetical protein